MIYITTLAIAIGFGTAVAAFAGAIGQGNAIKAALEGVARQPEAGGRILSMMIIGLALIESLTIYALALGFLLLFTRLTPAVVQQALTSLPH